MRAPINSSDRLFAFESDSADRLPFIPMAVRRKLDLAGARISLSQWTSLPIESRRALLLNPVGDRDSAAFWRSLLDSSLREAGTEESTTFATEDSHCWEDLRSVPSEVAAQAAATGLSIPLDAWARLDELTRFALAKLSRPGHANRNFLPALREAGLAP